MQYDNQEHQQLEEIMKQLEGVPASEPRFDALVGELTEKLRHHTQDEETEQFPQLRTYAPGEELVKLREKVDPAKKLAPTRPHAGAPHNELFHKLVGPGVGLVDRLRDRPDEPSPHLSDPGHRVTSRCFKSHIACRNDRRRKIGGIA